jgi:four helix bundle protein
VAIRSFRDLVVWQKSVDLVVEIYSLTNRFPASERFGITSQLRRAAVSVSSNIAEGSGTGTTAELVSFLTHSRGSLRESESLLLVSQRLEFAGESDCLHAFEMMDAVGGMLTTLRRNLRNKPPRPTRRFRRRTPHPARRTPHS